MCPRGAHSDPHFFIVSLRCVEIKTLTCAWAGSGVEGAVPERRLQRGKETLLRKETCF